MRVGASGVYHNGTLEKVWSREAQQFVGWTRMEDRLGYRLSVELLGEVSLCVSMRGC